MDARKRLFLSPPHMSGRERCLVDEVFTSNYVAPAGPMIEAFESDLAERTGIPHVVAVTSGTAAIHLALKALNLQPGDEVWASTLTFIGSIGSAIHERLVPFFIDSDRSTWTMDPSLLKTELAEAAKRGRLPKAIIPTDIYGQSCDLDEILLAGEAYGVPVICDSAEAVGALYKGRHAGSGAFATAFSFNGNKIITTSGGGALASSNPDIIRHARYLATQARQPVSHYEHVEVGFNYRMSAVCAAIGRGQLEVLEDRVARRRAIFAAYREALSEVPGITFMPEASYGKSTRWLTVIQIDSAQFGADPADVQTRLELHDIESRPLWKPMHMQPVFRGVPCGGGAVSEELFARGLCLPSGTEMTQDDAARVADIVRHAGQWR